MARSHLVTTHAGRLSAAAAGAVALALFAVLAWQAGAALQEVQVAAPPVVVATVVRAPARLLANMDIAPPHPTSAGADAGEHGDALRALLRRPPAQLRDSVLQAEARHGDGGRLYARYLLRQCAAADSVAGLHSPEGDDPGRLVPPDSSDPRTARALARLQQLRAACQQFTPAELSAGLNVVSNDAGDADPLLAEVDRFDAVSFETRSQIARVLSRPDPLLLQEIGPRLLQAYAFEGDRIDADIAEPALVLLPCRLGLPCDETDPQVWTACLQGLGCADSREQLVLQRAAPDDAARQQRILALARRLSQSLKAADASHFSAARGSE